MNVEFATDIIVMTLQTCVLLVSPVLLTAIGVGVTVSLVQSVTSIQEQTLTFAPKLVGVALVFIFAMPWMLRTTIEFGTRMIGRIAEMGP